MKLKRCSHEHFIRAIKGGVVVKVLSVDSHGKPALRFKGIRAIYKSEDAEKLPTSSSVKRPEGRFKLPSDCGIVKIEMPFQPMSGKSVESEPTSFESNKEGGYKKSNSDSDDDMLGSMTLKEIKERMKMKKRKISNSHDAINQEIGICSLGSKHDGTLQVNEDAELEETLSFLKLKLTKKLKSKRKTVAKATCASSESPISLDLSAEQILSYQNSSQNIAGVHGSTNTNIETLEPDNLDCRDVVHVADCSTSGSYLKMSYGGECFDEMPQEASGSVLGMGEPFSLCKENLSSVANEVSNEYLEPEESSLLVSTTETFGEITKVGFPEMHKSPPSFATICVEEANTTHCVRPYTPTEAVQVKSDMGSTKYQSIQKELHYGGGGSVLDNDDEDDNKEDASDLEPYVLERKTSKYVPDMITTYTLHSMELSNGGGGCNLNIDDESENMKDITPDHRTTFTNTSHRLSTSFQDFYPCFSPDNSFDFREDGALTAEQIHSSLATGGSLYARADVALQGSPGMCSDATNGIKDVEPLEDSPCEKTENPPKKLLSTRRAISPTSQEKLCQTLEAGDSCDNTETFKCREKLLFEAQTESKNSLVRPSVDGDDASVIPKQKVKKVKNSKNGSSQFVPRGILKVPPFSCSKPSSDTECTSIYTCAQKAIEFSQRQMHDIDSLAMKLTKELKSMKDIVEETLSSEGCQLTASKYTADQIKSAVKCATGVEETTQKWLSIMARDCTRFCKIMKSSEKSSLASGCEVRKKKKNITFADEDGGILCHVKVYKDPQHLPEVSESQPPQHEMERN